jgi:acetylornithine deacetylase/succinyl-diaminopimelate desuccinylase-like protein
MDPVEAQDALVAHLEAAAPWGVRVNVERESSGEPFQAHTGGPAYAALAAAMEEAYGRPLSTLGQGGSIPLCNVFADTYPNAEIILMGVEEPLTSCTPPTRASTPTRSPTWP